MFGILGFIRPIISIQEEGLGAELHNSRRGVISFEEEKIKNMG